MRGNPKEKNSDSNACFIKILMWHLVQGNVLEFSGMFKDFYFWLQITLGNQMVGESRFPL